MVIKTYQKGDRTVEVADRETGICVFYRIAGIQVNFHLISHLDENERKCIFDFLNT